ncbi:hypothetical protein [Methyloglobulus sp.]|uniref:hypothetical protein n=1 Tax=Methyloglobulus sp. TaxID=2518622 RepID=UPI003988C2FB
MNHQIENIQNAEEKLQEADYFLELMNKLDRENKPLTDNRNYEQEFSYLLSAFLKACYSVIQILQHEKGTRVEAKSFEYNHKDFYGSGKNGGLRIKTVHFKLVKPDFCGYVPSNHFILLPYEKYTPSTKFDFRGAFYFDGCNQTVCQMCYLHLQKIKELIEICSVSLSRIKK